MIRIKIPATSANLGAGFDSIGMAVSLYNYVNMMEYDSIDIKALDGKSLPTDKHNLICSTAMYLYELCGVPFKGIKIEQINNIPMARGLGSSSACVIAGLVGANALMGEPLNREEIINLAAKMEGHPDNSTPALLGGMVVAAMEGDKVYYVRQELKNDIAIAAIIPNTELKTSHARGALPRDITHKDAVFNLSRSALMAASFASGQYHNLKVATDDRIHQPYRIKLIEDGRDVIDTCYNNGAYGAFISGAGSTILSVVDLKKVGYESKMRTYLDNNGKANWGLVMLTVDNHGTITEYDM